ncbi:MAG: hypothetical protein ACFB0G_11370 [Leptolyngbyaceae cyanobacterium]|mgnify:CR=1 FL=1
MKLWRAGKHSSWVLTLLTTTMLLVSSSFFNAIADDTNAIAEESDAFLTADFVLAEELREQNKYGSLKAFSVGVGFSLVFSIVKGAFFTFTETKAIDAAKSQKAPAPLNQK